MYKNLAATLVAACFILPAFSQTPASAPLKQILNMNVLVQGVPGKLNQQASGTP